MNQIPDDIDELLLLQYLQGDADGDLKASVEAWLDADSGNRDHLDRLESLWVETGKISPVPVVVDTEAAWIRMAQRIHEYEKINSTREQGSHDISNEFPTGAGNTPKPGFSFYLWRAAALILLLIGMYSLYWFLLKPPKQIELASNTAVLHDTLPDGSKVVLNSNSTLSYPEKFSKNDRKVTMTGEAFFEVKKNASQPFVIDAGKAGIRVLGTSFRVKTQPSPTGQISIPMAGWGNPARVVEVNVISGSVMLFTVDVKSGDTLSVILAAGETGILLPGTNRPVRLDSTVPDDLFWANRSLEFRATPLKEVFALLKKYYPVSISVSDPSILECRLTASFVDESATRILTVIAESFSLTLETRGQDYLLTGAGCENKQN